MRSWYVTILVSTVVCVGRWLNCTIRRTVGSRAMR